MQITSLTQHISNNCKKVPVLAALFAVLVLCLCTLPQTAFAKDYSMPAVDIQATVGADGTLHVIEERTFDFDGSFSCVWWEFSNLEKGMILLVNGVDISFPQQSSSDFEKLPSVPFDTYWRNAGGPGVQSYSVDTPKNSVYVFFDASNTEMVVRLDYTVHSAVQLYDDCAELYWQYVGPDWAVSSHDVSCTITLPAQGQTGEAGNTVRAWGHGPLTGQVSFNDEATEVYYDVERVSSGSFAEARITFPAEWLTDVPADYAQGGEMLPSILKEEQSEADKANRHRIFQLAGTGLFALLPLAGVIWAAIMFFRHGKEHKPTFTDQYWRDVPNKEAHPVVIGRLMRWNREESDDIVTTIMHLANLGAISINRGSYEQSGVLGGTKIVEDYYITRNDSVASRLSNPIDTKLMKFLFGTIAQNRPSMWLSEISIWGKKHTKSFANKMTEWQAAVSKQVDKQDYFEEKGSVLQTGVITAAVTLFFLGLWITIVMDNLLPVGVALLGAVLMAVFGIFMPRRTQKGTDDDARAHALSNWLEDFTLLEERLPTDVKVWGIFMVYAQMFGIAKKVLEDLRNTVPQIFTDTGAVPGRGVDYVIWHTWYADGISGGATSQSFASAFENTLSNTLATVRAAETASNLASGGGGGGGFSGGGGGGFGGGGGGAR